MNFSIIISENEDVEKYENVAYEIRVGTSRKRDPARIRSRCSRGVAFRVAKEYTLYRRALFSGSRESRTLVSRLS